MLSKQPIVEATILAFPLRPCFAALLSPQDRLEIQQFEQEACENAYDRLVVHEHDASDAPELGSYLAVYRRGEPWSTWSLTRKGGQITAWSSVTSADAGPFKSMTDALTALLRNPPPVAKPMRQRRTQRGRAHLSLKTAGIAIGRMAKHPSRARGVTVLCVACAAAKAQARLPAPH